MQCRPQPPGGSSNLWDLVFVINGQDDSLLPASYSKGVMHMKHLVKFKTVSRSGNPAGSAPRQADSQSQREASKKQRLNLTVGNENQ